MSQSRFNDVFITQRITLLRTLERMVNNHSTAEDLLQETYLRVTRALSERAIDHLEPFVFPDCPQPGAGPSACAANPLANHGR